MGAKGSKEGHGLTVLGPLDGAPPSPVFRFHRALREEDREQREVVIAVCESSDKSALSAAGNHAHRLKITRHPNLIKYIESKISQNAVYVITEAFVPLQRVVSTLDHSQILLGLFQIARALAFLEQSKLAHNSVCVDNVFVSTSPAGDWKLGGLEFCTPADEASASALCCIPLRGLRPPATIPPEDSRPPVPGCVQARDAWCFGRLVESLLGHEKDAAVAALVARLCHEEPAKRARLADVLADSLFDDATVRIVEFLDAITLQPPAAKAAFFASLAGRVAGLPPRTVVKVLLPRFLNPTFLTEPSVGPFLPSLFAPAVPAAGPAPPGVAEARGVLQWPEYREHVLPFLLASYGSRSRPVRLILSECLHVFVSLIPPATLRGEVLGSTLVGLRDTSAELAGACVASLLVLAWRFMQLDEEARAVGPSAQIAGQPWAPRDGITIVNTRITPELCRVAQTDSEAALRVQALHALGGLWFLSPHAGTNRMLGTLKAGLQDGAREVRVAALRALVECKEAQSPWTCAMRPARRRPARRPGRRPAA